MLGNHRFSIEKTTKQVFAKIEVMNAGNTSGSALLRAVNINTQNSGGIVSDLTPASSDVGSVVHISSPAMITLLPGERREISYSVDISSELSVGDHVGAIAVTNTMLDPSTNASIKIRNSSTALFEITVPGPEKMSLLGGDVSYSDQSGISQVQVGLTNDGNKLLKSKGTITVVDQSGRVVTRREVVIDTILPGSTIAYPVPSPQLGVGTYSVHTNITYGAGKTLDFTKQVSISAVQTVGTSVSTAVQSSNPVFVWIAGILTIFLIIWFVVRPIVKKLRRKKSGRRT